MYKARAGFDAGATADISGELEFRRNARHDSTHPLGILLCSWRNDSLLILHYPSIADSVPTIA